MDFFLWSRHPDSSNFYVLKLDSYGDTIWTRTYGGSASDWAFSIALALDGGYVIVGNTYSFGAGRLDIYVVKIDADGDTLWTRTYGGINDDWGISIAKPATAAMLLRVRHFRIRARTSLIY